MAHKVLMPKMGESITEGTLTRWLKQVGDTVQRDEPLFEMATDKVDAEIPSPASGTLTAIHVQPGALVPIDTVVAEIAEEGAAAQPAKAEPANKPASKVAAAAPAAAPTAATPAPAATTAPMGKAAPPPAAPASKSSPLVRKMAAVHQVDLSTLQGSGMAGRITKQDMLAHLSGSAAPAAPTPLAPAANSDAIPAAYRAQVGAGDRVEDLSPMRLKIAEHMVLSKQISPHVGTVFEVDMSRLVTLRKQFKQAWADRHGVNLTYTVFVMKVVVDALKQFPDLNASIDGRKVIYHQGVNLGLAVALDKGLLVPVVQDAHELNTLGIARRAADLAARARTKKLRPDELQGGTFTITNPGQLGAMFNVPVINQPQVAILGVGTVEKRPVVIDDMIAIRTRAYLSLSFDHRLIDGALADAFMARVKQGIEHFDAAEL